MPPPLSNIKVVASRDEPVDYTAAAERIGCDVATILAVAKVEAPKGGFLKNGDCRILFEGHIFHKYTRAKYSASNPTLSYPAWTKKHYARGADDEERGRGEWRRLEAAMKLDRQAALMSASWGKFQIMGFNYPLCGFKSLETFIAAMQTSEHRHLMAFVEYVTSVFLDDELRARDWAGFARKYNGPLYQINAYDTKLARAYAHFSKQQLTTQET